MDENIQQNPNKNGTRFLKQGLENKKKHLLVST